MNKSIGKKIQNLKKKIRHHDHLYYNMDQPEITDYEYDKLFQTLSDLESQYPEFKTEDSPTQKIPGKPLEKFEKKAHGLPMLSLQNSYSTEEIQAFYNRLLKWLDVQKLTCFVEPKLDGAAVNLTYEKGILSRALTRGDGKMGENITENIKTLRGFPLALEGKKPPDFLELRGEVLISKKDFEKINRDQEEQGLAPFANPRNLAAGSLRQLNPEVTARRPLHCFIHSPGLLKESRIKNQEEFIKTVQEFSLPSFRICRSKKLKAPLELCRITHSVEDILDYYQQMMEIRNQLHFEIDGIVIKVNDFEQQQKLGSIARSPRWAIAGKFPPEQSETKVEAIRLQLGRTGVVTPVAVLKPVYLDGVSIRQASLHNFQDLRKKDIRVGDSVLIQRAGGVIPEVIKPIIKKGKRRPKTFSPPEKCPVCQSSLKPHGDYLLCPNTHCPAVRESRLIHFASKSAMNIEFLGEKSLKKFYDWGWLKSYADIYDLKDRPLKERDGFGEKSYKLLIDSLEQSKKTELSRLLFALGIPLVGEQTAQKISRKIYELHKGKRNMNIITALALLQKITQEELEAIEDIGPLVAQSFCKAFQNKELISDLEKLHEHGVRFIKKKKSSGILEGKTFVITGTLPEPRSEVKKQIEELEGRVQSQVSRKTDFLLLGENPGSKKDKADQLKVKTLTWQSFLKLIGRGVQ